MAKENRKDEDEDFDEDLDNLTVDSEDDELEYEVVDDTPEEDRGRTPPKKEALEEDPTDDEIKRYSKRAQDRIKQLSWQRHEERRRAEALARENQAAVDYAKRVYEENRKLMDQLSTGEEKLITTSKSAAEARLASAQTAFKEAYESGDSDKLAASQSAIAEAQYELQQAKSYTPLYKKAPVSDEGSGNAPGSAAPRQQPQVQQPQQQEPDPLAREWLSSNSWFGKNTRMTGYAQALHQELVLEQDVDPRTQKYWRLIDEGMRERFPEEFDGGDDTSKPHGRRPTVNGAGRGAPSSRGKQKVTLTQSEVNLCKKMGISKEQYAKEKIKLESRGT